MSEILSKENEALRARVAELERAVDNEGERMFERAADRLSKFYKVNGGDGYLGGEGEDSGDHADLIAACAEHVAVHFIDERDEYKARVESAEAELARLRTVGTTAIGVMDWLKTFGMTMLPAEKPWTDFVAAVDALRADEGGDAHASREGM